MKCKRQNGRAYYSCPREAEPGKALCEKHRLQQNERNRRYYERRKAYTASEWKAMQVERTSEAIFVRVVGWGLCARCDNKAKPLGYCGRCRAAIIAEARARAQRGLSDRHV